MGDVTVVGRSAEVEGGPAEVVNCFVTVVAARKKKYFSFEIKLPSANH